MILKRREKKANGEQSGSPKRSAPRRARDAEELLVERGPPVHRYARVRAVADEAVRVRAPSNASSKNAFSKNAFSKNAFSKSAFSKNAFSKKLHRP